MRPLVIDSKAIREIINVGLFTMSILLTMSILPPHEAYSEKRGI
jgi:hypothetical protein